MKYLISVFVLAFSLSSAFADHHEEGKKKAGHDKEHTHVTDKADHEHDENHHKDHDHKAHHPDHKDDAKAPAKKK